MVSYFDCSHRRVIVPGFIWLAILCASSLLPAATRLGARTNAGDTIACRVLEAHSSATPSVSLVVFHHSRTEDAARLATLLRQHADSSVEFQISGGEWQHATVLRLKSCFGRGLLVISTAVAQLKAGDEFILKFPSD
jgi:hypothetical protein